MLLKLFVSGLAVVSAGAPNVDISGRTKGSKKESPVSVDLIAVDTTVASDVNVNLQDVVAQVLADNLPEGTKLKDSTVFLNKDDNQNGDALGTHATVNNAPAAQNYATNVRFYKNTPKRDEQSVELLDKMVRPSYYNYYPKMHPANYSGMIYSDEHIESADEGKGLMRKRYSIPLFAIFLPIVIGFLVICALIIWGCWRIEGAKSMKDKKKKKNDEGEQSGEGESAEEP